jgi:hypothetical protein
METLSIILLKRLCSDYGAHLEPEKDKTVFHYKSIYTCFDTPLFSLGSTFNKENYLK